MWNWWATAAFIVCHLVPLVLDGCGLMDDGVGNSKYVELPKYSMVAFVVAGRLCLLAAYSSSMWAIITVSRYHELCHPLPSMPSVPAAGWPPSDVGSMARNFQFGLGRWCIRDLFSDYCSHVLRVVCYVSCASVSHVKLLVRDYYVSCAARNGFQFPGWSSLRHSCFCLHGASEICSVIIAAMS